MANSMSKTCRPKVRVMVAVITCGSRMVTSDSSTTVIALVAARAARGRISEAAPRPAPPANTRLPPKPLRIPILPCSPAGSVAAIRAKEKRAGPPVFDRRTGPQSTVGVKTSPEVADGLHVARALLFPRAHLGFGLLVRDAVAGLDLAHQLVAAALDLEQVVIRELAPLLLHGALGLAPGALDLLPNLVGRGLRR